MKQIPLKAARKAKKLTQAKLAAKIHKHQSFIAKLETGAKSEVTRDEAKALGRALGVDPFALTFGPSEVTA